MKQYFPPPQLKDVPKPSDLSTKKVVDGLDYYWCDNHGWCSHKTPDCKKPETGSLHPKNPHYKGGSGGGSNSGGGNRDGRAVRAYEALLDRSN